MKREIRVQEFLGMEVRVVDGEWIVLKDMFNALGRVREDGSWTDEKRKLLRFLEDINKICDLETFVVDFNKKRGKGNKSNGSIQSVECLKLETVPIVLTQFRPTARKGKDALNVWRKFMQFVNDLLTSLEVHKYIIVDKERHKKHMEILLDEGGSTMIANNQVNIIMAKLIGVYDQGIKSIKKDELKIYQPQTIVDLLEVRDFVMSKFVNAFEFTGSHKTAFEMALKLAMKRYKL